MKSSPSTRRYSISLIVSISIHAVALFFLFQKAKISKNYEAMPAKQVVKISSRHSIDLSNVKIISPKKLAAMKAAMKQQIVANELTSKKERPQNSRFMGQADQKVDRQTIAATNGSFKAAGFGEKSAKSEKVAMSETMPKPSATKANKANKELSLKDLGAIGLTMVTEKNTEAEKFLAESEKKNQKDGNQKSKGIEKGDKSHSGLAQNNDFVEDVPLGDSTNLNTTEFKYYGFYARIRQKLEQYWGSTIQSKAKSLYKTGRRLPASENLITAIVVTLDDRGNIVDIKIEGTSGIRELDQAAIESFNKAGPFPNPPKGLIVGGRATIQWGFVVKS